MEEVISFFSPLAHSELFLITLTVLVYLGSQWLRTKLNSRLLNPVLVASLVIIAFLSITKIDYQEYYRANQPINFMLGVSVVCLGYLMYENFGHIKDYKFSIIVSTLVGSIVGVMSIVGLCYLFGCDEFITRSLQPKSVTTPIALSLSSSTGGVAALTALAVSITGIFGSVVGPQILTLCGITDPIARGAALGSSAHAIGTARALELGALEGAVGGAAIGLMGLFTSFIIPFVSRIF